MSSITREYYPSQHESVINYYEDQKAYLLSLGAAAGVVVTGLGALSRVGVPSFVLFLIVILSGTARLQGWGLKPMEENVGAVEVTESDPSEALNAAGPETP